jgi:hypothetical protein
MPCETLGESLVHFIGLPLLPSGYSESLSLSLLESMEAFGMPGTVLGVLAKREVGLPAGMQG